MSSLDDDEDPLRRFVAIQAGAALRQVESLQASMGYVRDMVADANERLDILGGELDAALLHLRSVIQLVADPDPEPPGVPEE